MELYITILFTVNTLYIGIMIGLLEIKLDKITKQIKEIKEML